MTNQEIKRAIRELKREMKANGIPIFSCFNGGHSSEGKRYNERLFALKVQLSRTPKTEG